ncbi:CopC domain-containing protein YobA [Klebsiella sp. BIGb0407]|uniref:CopC domain-containing protein YobA n=1 Tax=Klebsiella sp. BIGb0407 TaxID=2940603 RepID=UPI002167C77D|nr:CopC domain-containing protein YobA [Klebsiella sp. BIGb0407]MCS3430406.1 methionine-rich copper-binding protein CopC [Klebsiella sp. BIGb0407]
MAVTTKRIVSIALFLTALGTSAQVLAHAHLKSHYPASDAVVTSAPQVITLDFSEGIEPGFSGIKITGPEKKTVKTAKAQRSAQDEKQLIVPVEEKLTPGAYQVEWHVVSVDGHKTKGNYQFTVK